jgi:UDP-2-acetamido-3-amino-2,3-dideoxy-glucuronate N-acetyltransferase
MTGESYFVHESAYVDQPCEIGAGTKIWHFCHILSGAKIGRGCNLGQNVMIGGRVVVGDNCKIQNNVSLYDGVVLEDDVFCGPSCVFTNVINPRSQIVRRGEYQRTLVRRGASIGANATIVCGATIGRYAFVGAGAVVRGDVPDYALMLGVPARRRGWMSRYGFRLPAPAADGIMVCPVSGWRYQEVSQGVVRCLDWDEEAALSGERVGGER